VSQKLLDRTTTETTLSVHGMTCAACVARVEAGIARVPGVVSVAVNLATRQAAIRHQAGADLTDALITAIDHAGYSGQPVDRIEPLPPLWPIIAALAAAAPLVAPMLLELFGITWALPAWAQAVIAAPVQFVLAAPFYRAAWAAVRHGTATMDVLVVVGTGAAYGLSLYLWLAGHLDHGGHLYFEAAVVVIALVLLGRRLESRARRRMGDAVAALRALAPSEVLLRSPDGSTREVDAAILEPGMVILVRPGERIGADGVVIEGDSTVDEALITGEARPVAKSPGSAVIGGAINGEAMLAVRISAVGADSALGRITREVERAQGSKAPIQAQVDRVSAVFVPAVLLIAGATSAGWLIAGAPAEAAIIHAVAVLVIACPCALGLATPTALMAGIGVGARHGILIRDIAMLERAPAITVMAFDKTGTLTEGRPTLAAWSGDSATPLLAAAVEASSHHPFARALSDHAATVSDPVPAASSVTALPGRGIAAEVAGRHLRLGSTRLMTESGVAVDTDRAADWQQRGWSIAWLAEVRPHTRLIGGLAFEDRLRPSSATAVRALQDKGIEAVMLTGDTEAAAAGVARDLGITTVAAGLLPAEKAAWIAAQHTAGRKVAMVGDGINDAPALATADISIAVAGGTDAALNAAAVALARPDPLLAVAVLDLARRITSKIHQNLGWAFGYNLVGIPLAAFGLLSPMVAGAAMAFSSVSVVLSALMLNRWRPPADHG
jgi:Cu+-exporting ATPase